MSERHAVEITIGPQAYMSQVVIEGHDISRYVTRVQIAMDAADLTGVDITLRVPLWDGVQVQFLRPAAESPDA
jgi:hypothetical protein